MNPAEQLKGLQLADGWTVLDFATRKPNATGGCFSQGYIVENSDGRRGFLKALDYAAALTQQSAPSVLLAMTQAYEYEKALCDKCGHLSRIARAIGGGAVVNPAKPYERVDYLIFELADRDIRAHLDLQAVLDAVFIMKTLHHVAVGLKQLHTAKIAHQDLKPSNVLVFDRAGSKICDLGRAWDKNGSGPYDHDPIAGDPCYAPPEFLYDDIPPDEYGRRFGCDLYHLGSLLVFCFTRAHANALLFDNLEPSHRPITWGESYNNVLPFVQAAFELAITTFINEVPDYLQGELKTTAIELCNPDPARRGHPKNGVANRFALERYISQFNRLSHVARLRLIRRETAA